MDDLDNEAMAEFVLAVVAALSEQMDVDRLIEALHRQHGQYGELAEPGAQAVARQIRRLGSLLVQIQALREKTRGPAQ